MNNQSTGKSSGNSTLRLVHLSDIHFSRPSSHGFDPDEDLRNEVARDIEGFAKKLGAMHALLVSGDVAFSGKKSEYNVASKWLDHICASSGCPIDSVYVCPGNHDIDQDVVRANSLLQDSHDVIRAKATSYERDATLKRRLEEPDARNMFYAPMREFNEFAARYECSFFADADSYAWDRPLTLNDGSTLCIRGLNSALLSGLSDNLGTLFLGSRAYTMQRHAGVEYLTMCHHPPNWLLDGREVSASLDDRSRIQLFGHEHDQRIIPGRDNVKLFAGSVNPHRREDNWRPGYNILEVSVRSENGIRKLLVNVHAREWTVRPPTQFRAYEDRNNNPIHTTEILLDDWQPNLASIETRMATKDPQASSSSAQTVVEKPSETVPMPMRQIVNRFFRLSVSKKAEIAGHLGLVADEDSTLPDVQRYKLAILRAKERSLMDKLTKMILEAQEGE